MRLIDADKLLQHTKFYNLKNGNRAIDEIDILHAPTVQAIPLAKVKQAREEISEMRKKHNVSVTDCLDILDKLIAESEEK